MGPGDKPPEAIGPDTSLLFLRVDTDLGIPEDEYIVLEEPLTIEYLATELEDGRQALLAFTSEEELLKWSPEGAAYVEHRAGDAIPRVFDSDPANDVVLVNAASDKVFVIPREDFD